MCLMEFGFEGVDTFIKRGLDGVLAALGVEDTFTLLNINQAGDNFAVAVVRIMPKADGHRIGVMHQFF